MFDLRADPDEQINLAQSAEHADTVKSLSEETARKWDEAGLTQKILRSQKRRAVVRRAMQSGTKERWNHGETSADQVLWYRGQQGYNEWAFQYL